MLATEKKDSQWAIMSSAFMSFYIIPLSAMLKSLEATF